MGHPGQETLDLLSRLIGFNTVSSRSNLELISYAEEFLRQAGARTRRFEDDSGTKANLIATIGPEGAGGLMLAGHTDVVPADASEWSSDPFRAETRGGRVYGRGAADMKGFIAAVLSLASEVAAMELRRPLHVVLTYDEETGCFGATQLAPLLASMPARPAHCVVGEPTGMKVVNGHKGKLSVDCRVRGQESHSAHNDRGVNAVEIAAELVSRLKAQQRRIVANGTRNARFDPPFTTVHTGLIEGGTARNIVPRECRFEAEIRNLPEDDPRALLAELQSFAAQELEPGMHEISPDSGIDFEIQSDIPSLTPRDKGDMLRIALAQTGANGPEVVSFATEAGLYQRSGIDVIVCGPGHIRDAHRPDESIELDQLARCGSFLRRLIGMLDARAN